MGVDLKMLAVALALSAILVGGGLYAASALAHGGGQGVGGMMGGSQPIASPGMGGMDGHDEPYEDDYGECPMMEYMHMGGMMGMPGPWQGGGWMQGGMGYVFMDQDSMEEALAEVEGVVVNALDRYNAIVVDTGDGTVRAKILPAYIDVENGYMVSGAWIFENIEKAVEDRGEEVSVRLTIFRGGAWTAAVAIEIDGVGTFVFPALYDALN
ncbi:hypothetical protein APE_0596 [Aeropyrum pernix K1]|uniref:Uncharacterized protein n=1 Tax=Aeropyrum pernix (strain ATCC 700893 / DSM 11879 / JCM 9820 / NBRC 100138 / K1) TaxID=272557 RepID=Q9YEI0_AERPE|nr:hypothetical protein [Aeropyrum pernix]BAA79566.1 hypothetical protein APE_0596 [Aeropyrum pernix K1]